MNSNKNQSEIFETNLYWIEPLVNEIVARFDTCTNEPHAGILLDRKYDNLSSFNVVYT